MNRIPLGLADIIQRLPAIRSQQKLNEVSFVGIAIDRFEQAQNLINHDRDTPEVVLVGIQHCFGRKITDYGLYQIRVFAR